MDQNLEQGDGYNRPPSSIEQGWQNSQVAKESPSREMVNRRRNDDEDDLDSLTPSLYPQDGSTDLLSPTTYARVVEDLLSDPEFLESAKTSIKILESTVTSTDTMNNDGTPPVTKTTGFSTASPKATQPNPPPSPGRFVPAANRRKAMKQPAGFSFTRKITKESVSFFGSPYGYISSSHASSASNNRNNQGISITKNYGDNQGIPCTSNQGNNQGFPISTNYKTNQGIPSTSHHGNNQGIPFASNDGNNQGIPCSSNHGNNEGIPATSNCTINQGVINTVHDGNEEENPMPPKVSPTILDRRTYTPVASAPQFYHQNMAPNRSKETEHHNLPPLHSAARESTVIHQQDTYFIAITFCPRCKIVKEHLLNSPGKWPTNLCSICGLNWYILDWKTYNSAEDKDVIYNGKVIKSFERALPPGYTIRRIKMEPQQEFPNNQRCPWCGRFHDNRSNVPGYNPQYNGGETYNCTCSKCN